MLLFDRLRVRPSTVVLVAVLAFVLTGLVAADRAFARADRSHASIDAAESAALVESFLAVQTVALNAFHGLYLEPSGDVSAERFRALVAALEPHMRGLRRVWLTDSSGAVVEQHVFGAAAAPIPPGVDLDTLATLGLREMARAARATGRTQLSAPGRIFSGERGIALLDPVVVDGRFRGFVGATVTADALLADVRRHASASRRAVVLRAGRDTVAAQVSAPLTSAMPAADALVNLPDGGPWRVLVAHAAPSRRVRVTLWAVGLTVLGFLVVSVSYERRQAQRTDERSRELERLSSELLRANRAKSEFLANVSHELRTPLNAIVGFVELLRDGVYGELNGRQIGPVDRIAASATHLRHLVDQVLDLAKMTAGRLEVHAEPLDLRPFVLDVVSEVEPLLGERGLNLSIGVGATLPRVRTDPSHLRQILVNLIGNAVKYTPQGGVAIRAKLVGRPAAGGREATTGENLRLRAPRDDQVWIALQVADTGIGIAPQDQQRIFDEFEQVGAGPRSDSMHRGTGLGLAISRRLARLLGGDLTVESELGKGSTFTLWLPVDPADVRDDGRRTPVAAPLAAPQV